MRPGRIWSALVALALIFIGLGGFAAYAQSIEVRYVHAVAPLHLRQNFVGSALQKAAFRQPDLLPVYGASEAVKASSPYQASQFFQTYPTGFETFEVAKGGSASLIIAQQIASLGSDLRGKAVVISFTPAVFMVRMLGWKPYLTSFSRLHANELIFSTELSFETKQLAAQRMLDYPQSLSQDPLLRFAAMQLANGSPLSRALYVLSWPLGKLQTLVLELQDHYAMIEDIQALSDLSPDVQRQPASIDWNALAAKARKERIRFANNNPYGFSNDVWRRKISKGFQVLPPGSGDEQFLEQLNASAEWTDLDILLRVLKEMGAKPLLLGRPMNSAYYRAIGISDAARQVYYDRLRALAARYNVPLVDFQNYATDIYFGVDPAPHTSPEGWIYVDQVLDSFYHQTSR